MTDQPRKPVVYDAAWTFHLTGTCVYCQKKVTRTRTFHASTQELAEEQADRAMANGLWHKKCGGS